MKLRVGKRLQFLAIAAVFCMPCAADTFPSSDAKRKAALEWERHKAEVETGLPGFRDVSVHDPSIVEAEGSYYIFGSHLAAARTEDLMSWEMVADGVTSVNPLFVDVISELHEIFDWSGVTGLWANDVIRIDDLFYMYPNLSRLDSPRASMGLAIADRVEGPYSFAGIFLQSGMWDEISEDGENIYDPQIHPNTVDPDAFFDQEGTMWMAYGSYSGGIFILEMDPDTGLPFEGQGYGKHLMGGNHSRIEGPSVLYSPHTGYYYMFVSFGGLTADGGYNIRVARSLQPDGPYYDALGNDMAEVKSDPNLPLFDDASIEPFAQKLIGSHEFLRAAGEPAGTRRLGYVSPGHNSALYDEETGRYFLVFHTRFPGRGEFHQVRVHEMFMNEEGWPVVAPHRYVPYTFVSPDVTPYLPGGYRLFQPRCRHKAHCWNIETISREETVGDYKLINHEKDISAEIKTSELVTLQADGTIVGAYRGSWSSSGGNFITLHLDGHGQFRGVMSRGWNENAQRFVVTFSAQSAGGMSIWGSRPALSMEDP